MILWKIGRGSWQLKKFAVTGGITEGQDQGHHRRIPAEVIDIIIIDLLQDGLGTVHRPGIETHPPKLRGEHLLHPLEDREHLPVHHPEGPKLTRRLRHRHPLLNQCHQYLLTMTKKWPSQGRVRLWTTIGHPA